MAKPNPAASFEHVPLDLAEIAAGETFSRIYHERHPDPLGFGKSRSRFSDPRRRADAQRFGVLYLGRSLKVCFAEAIVRDRRDGTVADYPIEEAELAQRRLARIAVASPLALVDLRGDGPIRMGVPSDVVGARSQTLARRWSVAFHDHPAAPDGIVYPSRLNEETNVAIYGRAVAKLRAEAVCPLIAAPGLARVLNGLKVALA
jgi:hypothetical protein